MVSSSSLLTLLLLAVVVAAYNASQHELNPLQWLGGNGPWSQGSRTPTAKQ